LSRGAGRRPYATETFLSDFAIDVIGSERAVC
jgi:hypothetical protein